MLSAPWPENEQPQSEVFANLSKNMIVPVSLFGFLNADFHQVLFINFHSEHF